MKTEILSEILTLLGKRSDSNGKNIIHNSAQLSSRLSSQNRSFERNRSPSNDSTKRSDVCYYHKRVNDDAQ